MTPETFNNKRIIWESKEKQALLIIAFFLFAATAIWTKERLSTLMVWTEIICCGSCGLSLLVRVLNPNNLFVTPNSPLARQISAERFLAEREDLDLFTHSFLGFSVENEEGLQSYRWTDIATIFAYRQHSRALGEICMDIFMNDRAVWRIGESTSGWHLFQERLAENIPSISGTWPEEMAGVAFAGQLHLLFDRKGGSSQDVEAMCYLPR